MRWSLPDDKRLTPEIGHHMAPASIQLSPDGKTLHSIEGDGRLAYGDPSFALTRDAKLTLQLMSRSKSR